MSLFKKIILGLLLSSFIGYLEWGKHSEYIGQIEFDLLLKMSDSPKAFLHPFILLPLLGQMTLLASLLVPNPQYWLVLITSGGIALLYLMLLFIGLLNWNLKITLFTLPFLIFYGFLFSLRKKLIMGNQQKK